MNIMKINSKLDKRLTQNQIRDQWMNDQLFFVYVEKDIFDSIENKIIMKHFQIMKTSSTTIIKYI